MFFFIDRLSHYRYDSLSLYKDNNNNNNVNLYTAHITWFHGGLQLCKGEIGHQHIEGASGCRCSPYVISPNGHPPRPVHTKTRPQHREPRPLLFTNSPGGGGVLPYISYIGMCRPKGYGFLAVLV